MFVKKFIKHFIIIKIFLADIVKLECTHSNAKPFKTYKIDLDKPAHERFFQPSFDFQNEIRVLFEARK